MSNFKKLFAVTVTALTVLSMVGFAPMGAKAATAGSLIKMAGNPAVYYFDGTKRYVFPNQTTYMTWYKDFSGVQTVSQSELQSYAIGGNVTMRAGTYLAKITTDPKVYAIEPGGVLRHIDTEARAVTLYGANWAKKVVDVPDAFFVNYTTGTALSSNVHPTGTVLKIGTQYYYVEAGNKRPFASDAALAANMINTAFAVETSLSYTDGTSITGAETALTNVAGSSSSTSTSAAGLTVSAGAMTASTSLPKGANAVAVGTWNFAAGPEGAVTLNSVTFKRTGVGNVSDVSAAYIYDGANRLTSGRTFNTSTNEVTFTLNLSIPAGSTKALTLKTNISTSAAAGDEHVFGVEAATKVSSNAASVNGVFPVNSNKHSIAGATAGTLSIEKNGSLTAPRVGDRGAKLSEFKLSASTEDAYVSQVTLTQGGNISNSAMSNFVLKQSGTTVATASAIASNERLDLLFSPSFKIEKGNNRVFELYADIDGRPSDTVGFYVDDVADVMATGGTFGLGMTSSINANIDQFSDTGISQTLQGGSFTISFDGPSSANISNSASDVVIWKGTIYSANQVEVRNWRFGIQDLTAAGAGLCESSSSCHVQDVKLWNLDNNTVIAGPYDFTPAADLGEAAVSYFTFTDDYTVNGGSTTHIGLSVDIRETPASGVLSLQATMGDGTNSFTANDLKNVGSNTYLTLGTDITPSSIITGQTQTVVAGTLTVTQAPSPTDNTMIRGASNYTAAAFNFAAGSGSAVKVNSVQVTASMDTNDDYDYSDSITINNLLLSAKLMFGTTQVGTTKSFVSGVATFDNLNWSVPASQTQKLELVVTTNSAYTLANSNDDLLRFSLAASSVSAVDANGNTISSVPSSAVNQAGDATDVITTVKANGSLTVALAPTPTNPSSGLHAAGSTDKVLAAFKFEAIDDSFNVKKLTLIPYVSGSAAATSNDRVASLKVRYPKQAGGTETRTVGLSGTANLVDISDMPMYVAQNGSGTLEVLADLSSFGLLDGTEAENIAFGIDSDNTSSNNQATGIGSNQDDTAWGTDVSGNQQNVYRTVLTVAAGSGTPNNTARTRSAAQKVASWNLSASSTSNAFVRGSKKAADGLVTGWTVLTADAGDPTVAASTAQAVSGTSSILLTNHATAAVNDGVYFDFASTSALDNYTRVNFWVRNSAALADGDIKFFSNDTANLTSLIDDVSIGAIATTAQWVNVDLNIGAPTGARYAGIYVAANPDNAATYYIDDFRFYTDSVNVDVAGDLNATVATSNGLLASLKDSGGTTRMYGAYSGTATAGTIKLIAGNGADTTGVTTYSDVEISSSVLALDLEMNTNSLTKADTTANEALSVSVDTGNVSSAGDFVWYDNSDSAGSNNMAGITVVSPTSTTITFSNTY